MGPTPEVQTIAPRMVEIGQGSCHSSTARKSPESGLSNDCNGSARGERLRGYSVRKVQLPLNRLESAALSEADQDLATDLPMLHPALTQ